MSRENEEKRGPRGADEHVGTRFPRERKSEERVPVRERDSMEQVRLPIAELKNYLREKLAYLGSENRAN